MFPLASSTLSMQPFMIFFGSILSEMQNVLKQSKKSSKVKQNRKISVFPYILTSSSKNLVLQEKQGNKL